MSSHPIVGKIITHDTPRDAIHVAICPLQAGEELLPGRRVRRNPLTGKAHKAESDDESCGIVDPFLTTPVKPNEWFYVFIPPGTITSLRHEWTHLAFP